ncbi:DNA polymerase III subunit alpha [Enterococcus timonensis]|uniref:DNA polymerase III subunit alpha n=1 Tax=Enterococcus timonensis TaxID=1852364 RepID=UPI0038B274F4
MIFLFPQIHTTSAFSLLKSTIRLPQYIQQAKKFGYQTLALTDENQLSGALSFCSLAQNAGLQPIIGVALSYIYQEKTEKILLYVENQTGYENILRLTTLTQFNGPMPLETILEKVAGLFVVLPSDNPAFVLSGGGQKKAARLFLQQFEKISHFSVGLEVQLETSDVIKMQQDNFLELLAEEKIACLLLHEVAYLKDTDAFSLEVLHALDTGEKLDLPNTTKTGNHFLWSQEQWQSALEEVTTSGIHQKLWQQAQENTLRFASYFDFTPALHQNLYPQFPLPTEITAASHLKKLANEKMPQRVKEITPAYQKRLDYELSVIEQMGFADYFLIVEDVLHFCHTHQVMTGAGRGSAAGSLVAFVLEITDVDPLQYDLLFERFLNPERKNMPDIDIDLPDNKREFVLQYVADKYGRDQVAQIATFGTMAAKMVLKDVARVFGLSTSEANQWSKAIPNILKITLKEAYRQSSTLKELVNANEKNTLLFQTALTLEGLPRHISTHAAGVVIGSGPLVQWVPLQTGANQIALTQFTMGNVETVGLLKMDFLGLKNLSILQDAVDNVSQTIGRTFDVHEIPFDDQETLKLFARGDTSGIFQFESNGIRSVLKRLNPTTFEDVAAVNALYRPGPMENIDHFIQRKKGLEKITYPDESLSEILGNTYGIIVYQEQVMQVANRLAGFTLGQADILRRAVSKKNQAVLDAQRDMFVKGAVKLGKKEAVAQQVYDYIERFGDYGFNRSHTVAYSFVAFQLAYLKVHYPKAFFTAILNSVSNNDTKIKNYLGEARRSGVNILPPDINQSFARFTQVPTGIRFGLGKIKTVRRDFLKEILATRRADGPFTSLENFLFRIDNKWLKEETIGPLIMVGAFDTLHKNRRQLISQLGGIMNNIIFAAGSMDLLTVMTLKENEINDYTLEERLDLEEEYLGTYLSGHPIEAANAFQEKYQTTQIADYQVGQKIQSFIYIKEIKKIRTKKNEQMAFVIAMDNSGETSFTIFPQLFRQHIALLQEKQIIFVTGKVEMSRYQEQLQVLVESIESFEEILSANQGRLYLQLPEQAGILKKIQTILANSSGNTAVILYFPQQKVTKQLTSQYNVAVTETLLGELKELLGAENVVSKDL